MPNYPFECQDCGKRFLVRLSYAEYDQAEVACPQCGGKQVQRRIGRVRYARSEESRIEAMADPSRLASADDDPKAMARMMREMSSEMGEPMGDEFNEVVDRLEAGQSPEDIEKSMPDMGGGEEI